MANKFGNIYVEFLKSATSQEVLHNFGDTTYIETLFNDNKQALPWLIMTVFDKIIDYTSYISQDYDYGLKYYITHYFTMILFSIFNPLKDDRRNDSSSSSLSVDSHTVMTQASSSKTHVWGNIDCPCKDDLKPFYQLMRDFAYYNLCYPRQDRNEESFFLQMFSKCKRFYFFTRILRFRFFW